MYTTNKQTNIMASKLKVNLTQTEQQESFSKLEALLICSDIINKNPEDKQCVMFKKVLESINGSQQMEWSDLAIHLRLRQFAGELK
jgi:hypothetical protein